MNQTSSKNYLSFDIELYNELPENRTEQDLRDSIPSVGAWGTDVANTKFYEGDPHMTKDTAKQLVKDMLEQYEKGFIPFTWNGLAFDFKLLGYYSEMIPECAKLALNGVDGMFLVVAQKGYYLGLEKVLIGANIEAKLHQVKLNDGTTLSDMSGAKAPELWRKKEFSAVKEYLEVDVTQPLKFAYHLDKTKVIRWTSNTNKPQSLRTEMLTVKEALLLPLPDTSWQKNPIKRIDFYNWIPKSILEEEGAIE